MDTINVAHASFELQAVIRFLHAEGQSTAEIHRRLCRVYGDNVTSDSCVREWCRKFEDGRTDVHEEGTQEPHSIFNDELVHKVVSIGDYDIVDLQLRYKKYIHKRTKHLLL
jgi:hypothetical protein